MKRESERWNRFVEYSGDDEEAQPQPWLTEQVKALPCVRMVPGAGASPSPGPDASIPGCPVRPVILASVFIAGFQHHHGMHPKVLWRLEVGARLVPVRESGNPYDCWAVALYTQEGARIGYLPRGCNEPIAMMMDQGLSIHLAMASVDPESDPWKRVRVTVWTELPDRMRISTN